MATEYVEKEVEFHEYCKKCENSELEEFEDPCYECLDNPVNVYSHKPLKFKERR